MISKVKLAVIIAQALVVVIWVAFISLSRSEAPEYVTDLGALPHSRFEEQGIAPMSLIPVDEDLEAAWQQTWGPATAITQSIIVMEESAYPLWYDMSFYGEDSIVTGTVKYLPITSTLLTIPSMTLVENELAAAGIDDLSYELDVGYAMSNTGSAELIIGLRSTVTLTGTLGQGTVIGYVPLDTADSYAEAVNILLSYKAEFNWESHTGECQDLCDERALANITELVVLGLSTAIGCGFLPPAAKSACIAGIFVAIGYKTLNEIRMYGNCLEDCLDCPPSIGGSLPTPTPTPGYNIPADFGESQLSNYWLAEWSQSYDSMSTYLYYSGTLALGLLSQVAVHDSTTVVDSAVEVTVMEIFTFELFDGYLPTPGSANSLQSASVISGILDNDSSAVPFVAFAYEYYLGSGMTDVFILPVGAYPRIADADSVAELLSLSEASSACREACQDEAHEAIGCLIWIGAAMALCSEATGPIGPPACRALLLGATTACAISAYKGYQLCVTLECDLHCPTPTPELPTKTPTPAPSQTPVPTATPFAMPTPEWPPEDACENTNEAKDTCAVVPSLCELTCKLVLETPGLDPETISEGMKYCANLECLCGIEDVEAVCGLLETRCAAGEDWACFLLNRHGLGPTPTP